MISFRRRLWPSPSLSRVPEGLSACGQRDIIGRWQRTIKAGVVVSFEGKPHDQNNGLHSRNAAVLVVCSSASVRLETNP